MQRKALTMPTHLSSYDIFGNCALAGEFFGAAAAVHGMRSPSQSFSPVHDQRLRAGKKKLWVSLACDERGHPKTNANYAGVNGCFRMWEVL